MCCPGLNRLGPRPGRDLEGKAGLQSRCFPPGEWPLFVTQTLGIWEPCLSLAEAGLPGALTRLRVNALGFLSSSGPSHSPQWVPFVVTKSPPISPSKSRPVQVEFNTQTLTQKLGLIAGFVWAQMCSSLGVGGGGHFSCHQSQPGWLHIWGRGGQPHASPWGALQVEPHLLSWCAIGDPAPPRRRQRSFPTGRPLTVPSFPFQQVTLSCWLALTVPGFGPWTQSLFFRSLNSETGPSNPSRIPMSWAK